MEIQVFLLQERTRARWEKKVLIELLEDEKEEEQREILKLKIEDKVNIISSIDYLIEQNRRRLWNR